MKKQIPLFLALTFYFSPLIVNAQTEEPTATDARSKVVFGLKAGLNRSNVFDEKGQDFVASAKTGMAGGLFVAIPIGRFIGLQPEILLSQKGFEGSGTLLYLPYEFTRTTTYLDIPLQLQLKPFSFFSMIGGVQYSYLLKQKDEFVYGPFYEQVNQEFKNDNIRKNIFGAVTGFDINIRHVVLSGRAGWDLMSNHGDGSSSTPRYKNLWLQGTIGFRFY